MTREEREQALEWFKNRPITMSGAKKMYDLAISALEQPEPCEDCISRQAAIEINQSYHGQMPNEVNHRIWKEINELPSAQPEQRWIPCSERLPEGITQVIIQTNGEAIHEAFYMGKDDYGHYVWKRPDNEIYWDEEVVAWMPLPTPYQPKEDES